MAFTLEDGTGVTGANAFVSVGELNEFMVDRGEDVYANIDSEKQAAIITASQDYIDTFFTFKGTSLTDTQGMQIPTDCVGLIADIKRACCMSAVLDLKSRLFVDPTDIAQKNVIEEESKVGSLMDKVVYSDEGGSYTTKYPTTAIDRILNKYTTGGSGLGGIVRG